MDETARSRTDHLLLKRSRKQLSLADDHRIIIPIFESVLTFPHLNSNFFRNNHAHDLFSCPHRFRFYDSGHWQLARQELVISVSFALLAFDPNYQIHGFFSCQEGISHGKQIDSQESVLDDTHNRRVVFGSNDLFGHVCDMFQFWGGLIGLRNVHVHLITVEIGVIGRADGQVQPEGVVGKDSHAMAHHTHSVESWLTVE